MPEHLPVEFNKRINQMHHIYIKARAVALMKLIMWIIISASLLYFAKIEYSSIKVLFYLLMVSVLGLVIKYQYKSIASPDLYKDRINRYLSIYFLNYDGENVRPNK